MELPSPETVLGDFDDVRVELNGERWHFFRRDGRYWVNAIGPDGEPRDFEVRYTFGFRPLQQYLVELPGGRLQALTAAWDSRPAEAGGQRWYSFTERSKPGDPLHWTGDGFTWNRACADCHSTDLRRGYVLAEDRYETRFAEIDVGCEACHGPGSRHVAWAEGEKAPGVLDKGLVVALPKTLAEWVMNPATGIAERRGAVDRREVEVCAPCHARRSVIAPAEPGGSFLDFYRPSLLDAGLYHADGQMLDEVYVYGSFLQSAMYRAGVTCSDCHDPHGLETWAKGNALCARCHLPARFDEPEHTHHPAGSAGSQCVACHLRTVTYMGVDPRHDHSFRVPRPDLTMALGVPNACGDCHADRPPSWAQEAVAKWFGVRRPAEHFAPALAAARRGDPRAHAALLALVRNREQPGIARATAASLLAGASDRATRDALRTALADEDALLRMAAAEAAMGLSPQDRTALLGAALSDPVRSVRIAAALTLADLDESDLPSTLRELRSRGLVEYRSAQAQSADQPQAHLNLGLLALARRDLDTAEQAYRDAIRIGPYFVPAHANLADLMRLRGDEERAEAALRAGLAAVPESADLHHALGLALVRRGRLAEAKTALVRAAELAPEQAPYAYVAAVALHSSGEVVPAIDRLEKAHAQHPYDREILLALSTMERDRGNFTAAVVWARRLLAIEPDDEWLRVLVADLERRARADTGS